MELKKIPRVFISYSYDNKEHKKWVKSFADRLINDGISVILDQYDLKAGEHIPLFIEQSISYSDYLLIICTPMYKNKADTRKGGVGYEGHIISANIFYSSQKICIPVIRKGTFETALPTFLSGVRGIDLSENNNNYEENYLELKKTILFGVNNIKPSIGKTHIEQEIIQRQEYEKSMPIYIVGIVTNEVTVPKNDGSHGSALYRIPFQLSKSPTPIWSDLFMQAWKSPPIFSTRHRPHIASVFMDRIILDGTTIEEVRDYHKETLRLCIEIANNKEKEIIEKKEKILKQKKESIKQHFENIENISNQINFNE